MSERIESFKYSALCDAKVLILGSMPGEESLRKQQYYAHPRNIFWEIMGDMLMFDKNTSYPERLEILCRNKIALWDVVYRCVRPGSLDSKILISTTEPNDFASFFKKFKMIRSVYFNGKKSEALFERFVLKPKLINIDKINFYQLPSTSPANASITKSIKKNAWSIILDYLNNQM